MGSRSKSRSSNTSGQTQNTMNQLAGGKVSNSSMMDMLSQLQGSQMQQIMPAFSAMLQMGQQQMGNNPGLQNFLDFTGQTSNQEQATLQDIIASMQPQQPEVPQQPMPGANPQQDWMKNLTPEHMAAIQRFNGYGGRR